MFTLCAALKTAECIVNRTTGLHVHVSRAGGYTPQHLARLLQLYIYLEDALDLLVPHHRRLVLDWTPGCRLDWDNHARALFTLDK